MIKNKLNIDTSFDFTKDTPHFWEDDFWFYKNGLGGSKYDPDILSPTLQTYHQLLWSKQLPNKEYLDLQQEILINICIGKITALVATLFLQASDMRGTGIILRK